MAPMVGPSRESVLLALSKHQPPAELRLSIGCPSPEATITWEGGLYRLSRLVMNQEKARKLGEERQSRGENFMPEHTWSCLEPQVIVETPSRKRFALYLERLPGWDPPKWPLPPLAELVPEDPQPDQATRPGLFARLFGKRG